MRLLKWDDLPQSMKVDCLKKYYEIIYKKRYCLILKRVLDILLSCVMIIILLPSFLIITCVIKVDSKGPALYRQIRVTQYGRLFRIYKFRTMIIDADRLGTLVTVDKDPRITKAGRVLRKYKLDEIPQLLNIIRGDMSFVGTRPEVSKYVEQYTDEMLATLLLPAGVTSEASIHFREEEVLLKDSRNIDEIYLYQILPEKMKYNLKSIEEFNFFRDIMIMAKTVYLTAKKRKMDNTCIMWKNGEQDG